MKCRCHLQTRNKLVALKNSQDLQYNKDKRLRIVRKANEDNKYLIIFEGLEY